MKYLVIFAFIVLMCSSSMQSQYKILTPTASYCTLLSEPVNDLLTNHTSGITSPIFANMKFECVGKAEEYFPEQQIITSGNSLYDGTYWKMTDSIAINAYLPAGCNYGVKLNTHKAKFDIISPYALTTEGNNAVRKAPAWLRPALEYTLSRLVDSTQKKIANVINNAVDPYIDEIAYSIAYSTPQFLSSKYCYPNLFVENARLIYENDKDLKYVEVVDHGNSQTDDNYYSTVKYWRIGADSQKTQIEVPKEIYYLDIVHPKTSDEIAAYVDSSIVEHNSNQTIYNLNIAAPPKGTFWRDFLYRHTEKNLDTTKALYPILKDSIKLSEVLWDETNVNPYPAVKVVTQWINDVMDFTSKTERPHQPIRIYSLHIGRCGEHEDITTATSRTCLIPCRGIEAYSSDHVWNEFWDKEWCQWEPVNNSYKDKMVYSKGWGKKFGSLFIHESTGIFTPVSDDYTSRTSKLIVNVLDKNNKPVDGARILLAVLGTMDTTNIYIDTYGITDNEGKFIFPVESGHSYFARVDCAIGNNPVNTNQVLTLNTSPDSGKTYSYKITLTGEMPKLTYTKKDVPTDTLKDYMIEVNYNINKKITNWLNYYDDLTNTYTTLPVDSGKVNLFVTDEDNYYKLASKTSFETSLAVENTYSGIQRFYAPENKPWYALLNTGLLKNNLVEFNAIFKLFISPTLDVNQSITYKNKLMQNYPNPVVNNTLIPFTLQGDSRVQLDIFTPEGLLIKRLVDNYLDSGEYSFPWDTKDSGGITVAPGVYIYRLNTGQELLSGKMIVIGS